MPSDSIGHYQILKKLGHGGMGEVYLAKDTKLERTVALKTLPSDVANDPKRRSRFLQEARLASHLKHPNITHVYDVGEAGGVYFIAMEHVEGETLDDAIRVQPLPLNTVTSVALQIAEALKEAHLRGIIHRDIKPSNVMLTPNGYVKVLDFGLARQSIEPDEVDSAVSTQVRTEPGALVGTFNYMSPEQALGRPLDGRTDIFSFGCLLYELCAGKRAFSGPTAVATIDSILHAQPELPQHLNADIPDDLQNTIMKCLRKDPDERYQTAADLIADLRAVRRQTSAHHNEERSSYQAEYSMPRNAARFLFIILQLVYVVMYVSALRWSGGMYNGLENVFGSSAAQILAYYFVITAMVGIALRLHLISLVGFDHVSTGVQYRKTFPILFALDASWAISPFGLSLRAHELLLLACVPPLAFSPFSQRTLIRSAYSLREAKRTSVG